MIYIVFLTFYWPFDGHTWSSKAKWSSIMTPRYLIVFTHSSFLLPIVMFKSGFCWSKCLVPNTAYFVFLHSGSDYLHLTIHTQPTILNVRFNMMSICDLPSTYRVVSSAYRLTLLSSKYFSKSLLYIMKSSGPRIEPWGTSHVTGRGFDFTPRHFTDWYLHVRYFLNQDTIRGDRLNALNLFNRILWSTALKAFFRSRNTSQVKRPLSIFQ